VKLALQVGTQVVLARLLGPEQYGLFAIGVIVISFSNFLSDIGLAYGLIQRKELGDSHIRFVFTWQLILGTGVTAAVAMLAGPLADFFREPRARDIILAMAPLCFVQATTAVSLNLLKRSMDFKTISLAGVYSYFLGFVCVGIPMALAGYQVWSLIAAWAVQISFNLAFLYVRSRHALRPLLKHTDSHDMARFGFTVLATNLTNWFIGNIDRVVAGHMLASTALGLYTTPYNLVNSPTATLMGVIQPVMYSACSKVQGELARIRAAYLALLAAITLFVMPVFVAIAVVSETFVLGLYGRSWADAALVLRPIALAMPLYLIWNISTPVLWTNSQISAEFRMQVPVALLWLVGSYFAVHYSIAALAWTVFGLFVLRMLVVGVAALRAMRASAREVARTVWPGVILSVVIGAGALVTDKIFAATVLAPTLRLAMVIAVCAMVALLAFRRIYSMVDPQLLQLLDQALTKFPAGIAGPVSGLMFGEKRS
jgi:lipopolysaccharide exporter